MKEALDALYATFTPTSIIMILCISLGLTGITLLLLRGDTKKYKGFRDNISNGAEVYASTMYNGFEGKVTNVDDEWVTLETKIRRHKIYPVKKK